MRERLTKRTILGSAMQKSDVSTKEVIRLQKELENQKRLNKEIRDKAIEEFAEALEERSERFSTIPFKWVSTKNIREIAQQMKEVRELEGIATSDKEKDSTAIKDSFIEKCVNGEANLSELDDYVLYWHTHDTGVSLGDYLGLTPDEYAAWEKGDDSVFEGFLQCRLEESAAFEQEID